MENREIYFSELDFDKLKKLVNTYDVDSLYDEEQNYAKLSKKLAEGVVLSLENVPHDIVTMDSLIYLRNADHDQKMVFELVFPEDADLTQNKISVLSPLGVSLIGEKTKRIIRYESMGGTKRLEIEKILQQPETDLKCKDLLKRSYSNRKSISAKDFNFYY